MIRSRGKMATQCRFLLRMLALMYTMDTGIMGAIMPGSMGLWKDTAQETTELKKMISVKLDKLDKIESALGILTSFPFRCPEHQMRKAKSLPVGTMKSGDHLYPEEAFCSPNGDACLFLRNDGNLVLYKTATSELLWSSGTSRGHCSADLTNENGRLVLYTSPQETVIANGRPVNRISWAAPAVTCQKLLKKDLAPGQDLGGAHGKAEADCCQLCRETPGCKGYSIMPYHGSCWLKPVSTPIADHTGANSGLLIEDTAGLELTFQTNGHLCLKAPASADCRWSTYDLMYKAK